MANPDTDESPAARIRALCDVQGEAPVAERCAEILLTGSWEDKELLVVLGGPHALSEYSRMEAAHSHMCYWAPTWAARGLVYAWSENAGPAVVHALGHEAWRVREMAAKVVAVHEIGAAGDAVVELAEDPVPRARAVLGLGPFG